MPQEFGATFGVMNCLPELCLNIFFLQDYSPELYLISFFMSKCTLQSHPFCQVSRFHWHLPEIVFAVLLIRNHCVTMGCQPRRFLWLPIRLSSKRKFQFFLFYNHMPFQIRNIPVLCVIFPYPCYLSHRPSRYIWNSILLLWWFQEICTSNQK